MSDAIPSPAADTLPHPDGLDRFVLRGRRQIRALLQELIDTRARVTVFPDPSHSFISVLLQLTDKDDALLLDCAPDAELNARALQSTALRCVTELSGIRIQFTLEGVDAEEYDDGTRFNAWVPTTLLRLQRREFFRLETPLGSRPQCSLRIIDPDGMHRILSAPVLDVGAGGLAVTLVEEDAAGLQVGKLLRQCVLHLAGTEPLTLDLEVRDLTRLRYPSGVIRERVGLRYVELDANVALRVERYILQAQSERPRHLRGR